MDTNRKLANNTYSRQCQFSCSVMSNCLQPLALQYARLPRPSPTPGACSNSCPSNRWCNPTISSSVVPSSSCLQSFPASGTFPVSQLFASGGQSIGVSASASVRPMNIQNWFLLGLSGFDLLAVQWTLKSPLQQHNSKTSILQRSSFFMVPLSHPYMTTGKTIALTIWILVGKVMVWLFNMLFRFATAFLSAFFIVQLSHPYMTTGKTIDLTRWTFVGEVMSLHFNMLSSLIIALLPRRKHFLKFTAAVTICSDFGAQENKVCHCFHCSSIYLPLYC